MLDRLLRQVMELVGRGGSTEFDETDPRVAVAALMVHVVAADGVVTPHEKQRLLDELGRHYGLSLEQVVDLYEVARAAEAETPTLQSFTAGLKRTHSAEELRGIVTSLWRVVHADGVLHEFEDNVVGRIADMLGVPAHERIGLRKIVEADEEEARAHSVEDIRSR